MTDKLREAAQQALGALIQADQRDGMYSYELEIAALRAALAQQDAHMQPAGDADMTVYRGIAANYHKDKAALAQQDEQTEQESVAMRYDYDGYGYKYIDAGSGSDWQTRVKGAEPVFAAPTPPAQRVMLTDEEIEDLARGKSGHSDFARDIIEAYERKNGIK